MINYYLWLLAGCNFTLQQGYATQWWMKAAAKSSQGDLMDTCQLFNYCCLWRPNSVMSYRRISPDNSRIAKSNSVVAQTIRARICDSNVLKLGRMRPGQLKGSGRWQRKGAGRDRGERREKRESERDGRLRECIQSLRADRRPWPPVCTEYETDSW